MEKLRRERRIMDKQARALLKLPNKKERQEIEELNGQVALLVLLSNSCQPFFDDGNKCW